MEKPISLVIEETKQSLIETVNNCRLHPSIIEMIVKDIYIEICQLILSQQLKKRNNI